MKAKTFKYFLLLGSLLAKGRWSCFPCVGWHEIMWMFWFFKNELQGFSQEQQTRHVWLHVIINPWPPGGVGASVWNMGLTSTSQKLWEEGGKGRGGKGWGHSFWHQGLNHVGPKSGPENLKLRLHSWVVNQTWPQLTCKVTDRVPEVVTVNKVYRTCPVVAIEKSIPNGLWRTKRF